LRSLTGYERRSLLRFLSLYLGSVFLLLAIIGWLFFEHNASMMKSAMKFEMLSEAHRIESRLTQALMRQPVMDREDLAELLKTIRSDHFKVGFYDADHRPIYSEITGIPGFEKPFYAGKNSCFSTIKCPLGKEGVAYIALQETKLKGMIRALRWKIIGYLVLSFLFMAIVGYFLARLFMRPIREKIEALDRFIEETTHELNTPVSAILMTIRQLKGVEEKKLRRLQASAQRLSTMYDSLSHGLGRELEEKESEVLDLAELCAERCDAMEPVAQSKRIRLEADLEPCRIRINREELRRLVDNILSNAIKYSDPGGEVTVRLRGCRLTVADRGIGMSPEERKEIFKRYTRANKERGGFGIGLSIVAQICREYGIGLELESAKGKGSLFTFDFGKLRT
jgi:two-component system OmpR family sensor kinase